MILIYNTNQAIVIKLRNISTLIHAYAHSIYKYNNYNEFAFMRVISFSISLPSPHVCLNVSIISSGGTKEN